MRAHSAQKCPCLQVRVLEKRFAAACEAVQASADAESASMAACLQAKLSAAALQELQATLGRLQAAMANAGASSCMHLTISTACWCLSAHAHLLHVSSALGRVGRTGDNRHAAGRDRSAAGASG